MFNQEHKKTRSGFSELSDFHKREADRKRRKAELGIKETKEFTGAHSYFKISTEEYGDFIIKIDMVYIAEYHHIMQGNYLPEDKERFKDYNYVGLKKQIMYRVKTEAFNYIEENFWIENPDIKIKAKSNSENTYNAELNSICRNLEFETEFNIYKSWNLPEDYLDNRIQYKLEIEDIGWDEPDRDFIRDITLTGIYKIEKGQTDYWGAMKREIKDKIISKFPFLEDLRYGISFQYEVVKHNVKDEDLLLFEKEWMDRWDLGHH